MEQNKYEKTPLVDLITQMTYLERDINLKMIMYEEIRQEVVRRFPIMEQEECFQQKELVKKVSDYGKEKRR